MRGKGCTLEEKILSMLPQTQVSNFLQYMLIRYILSSVIWGEFSVQWLRQEYTERFERKIRNSQFEVFLPYLNRVFAQYFIC